MVSLIIFLVAGSIFLSTSILCLSISGYAYRRAFYFPVSRPVLDFNASNDEEKEFLKGLHSSTALLVSQDYEPIYIESHDKLFLFGRYYHIKDGAPLFIEFHGYKGDACRDFSGGDMVFKSLKCNTLLVDQRAHGQSDGRTISFGVKERYDCLAWINYARARFGNIPIFLVGISMGGATVLMASDLDLPSNVKGIISDCAYSSPKSIICKVCTEVGLRASLIYPFITLGAILFGHFNPNKKSAIEAVKHARVPIMLIHGEGDRFVPCQMSNEIYESCASEKYLYTFKGAGHGFSFASDVPRYEHIMKEFIINQLGKQNGQEG